MIMKGIIPGVGSPLSWTIIPGKGVQIFLVYYYPSTRDQQSTVESIEDLRRHEMPPV
jgi:hypothetical protein